MSFNAEVEIYIDKNFTFYKKESLFDLQPRLTDKSHQQTGKMPVPQGLCLCGADILSGEVLKHFCQSISLQPIEAFSGTEKLWEAALRAASQSFSGV